jgi:signal transduction histidine kinase/ActR/RegA family two-component response regulator
MSAQLVHGRDHAVVGLHGMLLDVTLRDETNAALRESELRLRVLHSLNEVTRDRHEPESMLRESLRVLGQHLGVTRCAFAIVEADGDTYTIPADYAVNCQSMVGRYSLHWFGEWVVDELSAGRTLVLRDTNALPPAAASAYEPLQIRASVCCSLLRQGQLRALMAVHQSTPRDWTAAEIALVQEVVERCWSAIEHNAAEARLREQEALLRMASQVAHFGAFRVDLTPRERWTLSTEAQAMLEAPADAELTREQLSALLPAESLEAVRSKWARGSTFDMELPIVTFKGSARWLRCVCQVERDVSGAPVRIHGALLDVNDRHKLEEQLRQAQKIEAIGQLAGGVAHDFNNLLSVILSYSEMVATEPGARGALADDIEEIRRAALRAGEVTQQLLAFSRRQVRQPRVIDLSENVRNMERLLRRLLSDDVPIALHTAAEPVTVFADPGQIEQIVLNLVINARDAMPSGGSVTVETARVQLDEARAEQYGIEPGEYGQLTVSDTGMGMSAETCARIFEPFFTTKDKSKGTGLGLSTVHGIVAQNGGHVSVHSELGRGSQFEVYLPQAHQPVERGTPSTPPPPSLSGQETVLVVDDDDPVRSLVCSVLRRHGYDVLEAQNGGEAFLICEQTKRPIHLLLTDVVMPRVSGPDLALRLGSMRPEMRVLYMSGYAENSIIHRGVVDRDLAFLPKPITPNALLLDVRRTLDGTSPPAS